MHGVHLAADEILIAESVRKRRNALAAHQQMHGVFRCLVIEAELYELVFEPLSKQGEKPRSFVLESVVDRHIAARRA